MKRTLRGIGIFFAGLLASAAVSSAAIVVYQFPLTPEQEVVNPPVVSNGFGSATVTLNTDTNFLEWNISYQDLTSNLTSGHFHGPADFGVNAGVVVNLAPTTGMTSGTIIGSATIDDTTKGYILDGLTYINLHTLNYPGGEIRGQVIPEPGTYALLAGVLGLGAALYWRRRRS